MALKFTVNWKGSIGRPPGHKFKSTLLDMTSTSKVNDFLTVMDTLSDAIAEIGIWSQLRNWHVSSTPAPGVDVNRFATAIFRKVSDGQIIRFSFPAPKANLVEMTPEGERLDAATMVTIKNAIEAAIDDSLSILYGFVGQKR